ncbi:MAG: DUF4317 domain-containing protein [bacterium]|nr:DUF4317 domain-containing protein [bacterium]
MNKKDVLELKRRLKKDGATFTRLCGCYVNSEKEKVVTFGQTFLNLEDEEFYKYLDIAKKVLSGTIGNNLLTLDIPLEQEQPGGRQQFLLGLRESKLKNDELVDRFYDMVIENYDYVGNYLILVFHDAYDVMTKTTDNDKLDESEEVYEYLLGAICPVALSKPGLGYRADENRIGPRIRDWVVGVPDSGFVFPAFNDRSTDIHSLLFYTRDTKEPHTEFMEDGLGCGSKRTSTEQKNLFSHIVKHALGDDDIDSNDALLDIQQCISDYKDEQEVLFDEETGVILEGDELARMMSEVGIPDSAAATITENYREQFKNQPPMLDDLIDVKSLEANARIRTEEELRAQVEELKQQVAVHTGISDSDDTSGDEIKTYDVILRVKPEKVSQIKSQFIDGQKCLVIPMSENEHAAVNGVNTTV